MRLMEITYIGLHISKNIQHLIRIKVFIFQVRLDSQNSFQQPLSPDYPWRRGSPMNLLSAEVNGNDCRIPSVRNLTLAHALQAIWKCEAILFVHMRKGWGARGIFFVITQMICGAAAAQAVGEMAEVQNS